MKQITELTEQEILALTDDQLSKMVQYKMAEAGIKILTYPEAPNYSQLPAKDWTLYKVEGVDKLFVMSEDAEAVGKLLNEIKGNGGLGVNDYINYDSLTNFAKNFTSDNYGYPGFAEVKEHATYREKTMMDIKSIIDENKVLKTNYDAAVKEYKEVDAASSDIKLVVYGTYKEVVSKYERMAEMQYHYQRYLKLADGNETIAMNFLKSAYSIDEQTEYYVQGKEMPGIADEEEYHTTAKSEGCAN